MNHSETMKSEAGLLYILPTFPGRAAGVEATWITGAALAEALGRYLGGSELLTPFGLASPAKVRAWAVRPAEEQSAARSVWRAFPRWARLPVAEVRDWRRSRLMRAAARRAAPHRYGLVMQLHSRYQDCGQSIARAVGAPFVLRVEALEVREEAAWGIRRPVWGRLVERAGELRIMRRADLVAAVSDAVDRQLADAGIDEARRVVVPSAVDLDTFSPGDPDSELLRANGLEGRFVVGWIGGFRPFHGLEAVPAIARGLRDRVPGAVICLVGNGPERKELISRIDGLRDVVRIPGLVPHGDVPKWIRSFDACLLLAGQGEFHYSPLKLYEYLGCGRPVVAVVGGEVGRVVRNGLNGLLVPPGRPEAIVDSVGRLAADPVLRVRLGREARRTALAEGSWDQRARTLIKALEDRGMLSAASRVVSGSGGGGDAEA